MSYCTLDEAFGDTYLNQQNRVNSNVEQKNSLNSCVKRSKIRRKKINCNEKKNRFDSNNKDLNLNSYNPKKGEYELINSMTQNKNSNLPGISSFSFFPDNYEHFTSSNENMNSLRNNSQNNSRNNSQNNSRNNSINVEPNEIFEYSQEENFPIESSSDYEVVNSTDEESENIEETLEAPHDIVNNIKRNNSNKISNSNSNKISNSNNSNNVIASQISEINNKINFMMNSMNNDTDNNAVGDFKENNIHDIILFVIFGIFVLLVLESLFKLATKILLSKNGVKINL